MNKEIKILCVDDASAMRRIVKNILRQIGFHDVDEAKNGIDALEKLRVGNYDLIMSDWNMPEKTGIELLRDIRADPNLGDVPFLMVTAEAEKENVVEAIEAGVSSYILKPFSAHTLGEKLDAILP